ncbi:hypothetical protein ACO0K7_14145 [Undibacterium sp. Ji67W]|uniref:hypothetical protein n=1 Tax=Undibacterium sp. Ji67W TaxID=3413042 RepID=UPI003BF08D14
MNAQRSKFSINAGICFSVLRSFNVAAMCALAVWHGYVFHLNQALLEEENKKSQTPPAHIKLQRIAAASTTFYLKVQS